MGRPRRNIEHLARLALDAAPDAILVIDEQGRVILVNSHAESIFGYARQELLDQPIEMLIPERFRHKHASLRSDDQSHPAVRLMGAGSELLGLRKNGTEFPVEISLSPTRLDGEALVTVAIRDVSEPGRTGARFAALIERSQEGISLTSADGTTIYASPGLRRILGCEPSSVIGRKMDTILDSIHPDDRQMVKKAKDRLTEAPSTSITIEYRSRHADGTWRWIESTGTNLLDDPAVGAIVGNFRDITERKRAEETRARLAIVESVEDAIVGLDLDGIISNWNRGAENLLGHTAREVIGKSVSILAPPGRDGELRSIADALASGQRVMGAEMVLGRKDGSEVEVSLTVSRIWDAAGKLVGLAAIARDVTERNRTQAALRQTEEQLRQAQKMEAIGRLAGGVAHDFNNLLSVIFSYTDLAREALASNSPLRADLGEVKHAAQRAQDLTRQLLAFSRAQILSPKVLNLNQVVLGMEKMLGRVLGEDVELALLLANGKGNFEADPGQIEQVIMNLAVNARDAMPQGGKLTIETADVVLDAAYAAAHADVTPGRYVMLAVTDTGAGMDAATRARIFEPFFTTKAQGKGTGLGLATVFGIVRQSGGHIWVYSEPRRGTCFKVYFPRTDAEAQALAPTSVAPPSLRGTERILLVEDDERLRAVMGTVLKRNGYSVLEAQSAGEAFLVFERSVVPIDLLLTDVVMPRVSGPQLARQLAQLRPEMRVLFVSGYPDSSIVHHAVLDPGVHFLQKPITPDALLCKVRQVLDTGKDASRRQG